jgi:hypothetical protein
LDLKNLTNLHKLSVNAQEFIAVIQQNLSSITELIVFDYLPKFVQTPKACNIGWPLKKLHVLAHDPKPLNGSDAKNLGYGRTAVRKEPWKGIWELVSAEPLEMLMIDALYIQRNKFDRDFYVETSATTLHLKHLRINFDFFIHKLNAKTKVLIFEKCRFMDLVSPVSDPNISISFVKCHFRHPDSPLLSPTNNK